MQADKWIDSARIALRGEGLAGRAARPEQGAALDRPFSGPKEAF